MRNTERVEDVITIGRYAKAVGIGRTTAYVQARAGEIPFVWRGDRFEMSRADFERLLGAHRNAEATAA